MVGNKEILLGRLIYSHSNRNNVVYQYDNLSVSITWQNSRQNYGLKK